MSANNAYGQDGGTGGFVEPPGAVPVSDNAINLDGPPAELSDIDRKKRAQGVCCFNLLGLVATAAFICGIYSYAYCDFIARYVTLTPEYTITGTDGTTTSDYTKACNDLGYGSDDGSDSGSNNMSTEICSSLLQDHGIGFSYWQATIPVDKEVCFTYTQLTPWGFVTPEFDSAFNASKWFSIIGYVFGGAGWFSLTCSCICRMDQNRLKGIACYFMIATLFQGLSLIMFNSNVCSEGFFKSYFVSPDQQNNQTFIDEYQNVLESVSCTLSLGSKMAISATVLWAICSVMVPFSIVPFYEDRVYQSGVQRDQQNNPDYSHDDPAVPPVDSPSNV